MRISVYVRKDGNYMQNYYLNSKEVYKKKN